MSIRNCMEVKGLGISPGTRAFLCESIISMLVLVILLGFSKLEVAPVGATVMITSSIVIMLSIIVIGIVNACSH